MAGKKSFLKRWGGGGNFVSVIFLVGLIFLVILFRKKESFAPPKKAAPKKAYTAPKPTGNIVVNAQGERFSEGPPGSLYIMNSD